MKQIIIGSIPYSGSQVLHRMFEAGGFQTFNQSRIFAICGIAIFRKYSILKDHTDEDVSTRIHRHWYDEQIYKSGAGVRYCIGDIVSMDEFSRNMSILAKDPLSLGNYIDTLFTRIAKLNGKEVWCETTPGNIYNCDEIISAFPNAKFINVIRNPYASLFAIRSSGCWGTDFGTIYPIYHRQVIAASNCRKDFSDDRMITIKVEELISDEKIIQNLYGLIGIEYDSNSFIGNELWSPLYCKDRWERDLTEKDRIELEDLGIEELCALQGYEV